MSFESILHTPFHSYSLSISPQSKIRVHIRMFVLPSKQNATILRSHCADIRITKPFLSKISPSRSTTYGLLDFIRSLFVVVCCSVCGSIMCHRSVWWWQPEMPFAFVAELQTEFIAPFTNERLKFSASPMSSTLETDDVRPGATYHRFSKHPEVF